MRQNAQNFALYLVVASAVIGGWYYVEKTFFPPPPPEPERPRRESLLAIAGSAIALTKPADSWSMRRLPEPPKPIETKEAPKQEPTPLAADEPPTFTQLGDESSYTKVILTSRGGGVQQLTLTRFEEANRLGKEVKRADGSSQPLRIIPGVLQDRSRVSLTDIHDNPAVDVVPDLSPGVVGDPKLRERLAEPSHVILHYLSPSDDRPSAELGERTWALVENGQTEAGGWKAVYQTELSAPFDLRLRKTFTLGPKDYHLGFKFEMIPLPGRENDKTEFRYQVVGPRGMPIEGEWYTYTFRNVMAGWTTPTGGGVRSFDDAMNVQIKHGGDKVVRGPNIFNYAAVVTQYFAGAVAIDDTQPKEVRETMWDYVRPTREPSKWDRPDQLFLADVTVRAVSSSLVIGADKPIEHSYLLYHGPVKVALLSQLRDNANREQAVDPALVERYREALSLRTLTDYPSPNFFGRAANFLWWSDLIIFFTNVMHWVLGLLHNLVPVWGLNIVMLTVLVRLTLFYPSRKQQTAMMRMQEKMAKLKPEIDKLQDKYKDDWRGLQQAKAELMRRNGANPVSTMGGCLLLFAQMPVLMGLYFCLQESVFFRLDPFMGWVANLAAPDMLVWWSERIPFISTPEGIGGTFYLGPYLNILPIVAVILIFIQQKITLPPPTDEQMEMQQKTMKMMVIFMAIFFYKVPAGLCIYFICGTLWALGERKLIPKVKVADSGPVDANTSSAKPKPTDPVKEGGFLAKLRAIAEEKQRQYEEQSKRQIRNSPPGRNRGNTDRRDQRKRK